MNALLLRCEAVESRIASYPCPAGSTGRLQALRLRRYFREGHWAHFAAGWQRFSKADSSNRHMIHSVYNQARHDSFAGSKSFSNKEHASTKRTFATKHREAHIVRGSSSSALDAKKYTVAWNELLDGTGTVPPVPLIKELSSKGFPIMFSAQDMKAMRIQELEHLSSPGISETDLIPKTLHDILLTRNPTAILEALSSFFSPATSDGQSPNLLSSISSATFSEIFRFLDPDEFIGPYEKLYRQLSPAAVAKMHLDPADGDGHYAFSSVFLDRVIGIMSARRLVAPLCLADYKYLLKCARSTGNIKVAHWAWQTMMNESEKIEPDTECYNHYLATICFTDITNPNQRYRLRVIPDNVNPRTMERRPYQLDGHGVGPKGIQKEVQGLFAKMRASGATPNQETISFIMIGLAREGSMDQVESLLKSLWDIDVEQLLTSGEDTLGQPRAYAKDSSMFPGPQLLYTIAHAYGINSMIPKAMRIIDYISKSYDIQIPLETWTELLQWTYVSSADRTNKFRTNERVPKLLPKHSVGVLFKTMTSKPYNVKPTIEMYDKVIRSLLWTRHFSEAQYRMEEARYLHKKNALELSRLLMVLGKDRTISMDTIANRQRAQRVALLRLELQTSRYFIKSWVRNLIRRGSNHTDGLVYDYAWTSRNLPHLVHRWRLFLPEFVNYDTPTGYVKFRSRAAEENKSRFQRYFSGEGTGLNERRRAQRFTKLIHTLPELKDVARREREVKAARLSHRRAEPDDPPPPSFDAAEVLALAEDRF